MKHDNKNPDTWISRDLFEAYCGAGSQRFLNYYDKAVKKKSMLSLSLNWPAILFLPAWLGYRKQWTLLLPLTLLITTLPFLEVLLNIDLKGNELTGPLIALGLLSNGFLLTSAQSQYLKLKKKGMDDKQIETILKDKASPSVLTAFAGFGLCTVIPIVSVVIADALFGGPAPL